MLRYLIRRLLFLGLVAWGAVTVVFFLAQGLPGDPARVALGPEATQEMIDNYRREIGLDQPVIVQYARYVGRLVQGDFGRSIVTRSPVRTDLKKYIPATVELMLVSLLWSVPLGIVLGILAASSRGRLGDQISRLVAVFGMSMPVFWFGLVLQLVFYRWLGLLPSSRRLDPLLIPPPDVTGLYLVDATIAGEWRTFWSAFRHLLLPSVALATINIAAISRMTRSSLLLVLHQDYVRTARSKGLPEHAVFFRHALRNSLVPILTETSVRIGAMFGGAVLTETIFAWPGSGRYAFFAVRNMDFPVISAFTLWTTAAFALVNLLVDLSYGLIDRRIQDQT